MAIKKIVFAINQLGIGGAENMVIDQINSVDRSIFKPVLITIFNNPQVNLSAKISSDIVYKQFNFSGFFDICSWWNLFKFFKKEKFYAVITNLFMTNFIVRLVAIFTKVPIILSYEHSVYSDKKRWQIVIDKILSGYTKKIFVGSTDVLEFTSKQEHIKREKFCLNYNSIPLNLSGVRKNREKVLREFNLPTNFFYIVTVGRLIKQKGHCYLIAAAKMMRERGIKNFKVLIFGQGILESELNKTIISLGMQSDIKIMGLNKIDKILAISDAFVMPSLWEGLSIALLQAMDAGLPIVATNVSGSKEVIMDGLSGLLVNPANSGELAMALGKLIKDDSLRNKLSSGALDRVKNFSIESNIRVIQDEILSYY